MLNGLVLRTKNVFCKIGFTLISRVFLDWTFFNFLAHCVHEGFFFLKLKFQISRFFLFFVNLKFHSK